jgi:hypothetical protein
MCLAVMLSGDVEHEVLQVAFELGQFLGEGCGLGCCRDEFAIVLLEAVEAKRLQQSISGCPTGVMAFQDVFHNSC